MTVTTLEKLQGQPARLAKLMADPQPGLSMWWMFVSELIKEMYIDAFGSNRSPNQVEEERP